MATELLTSKQLSEIVTPSNPSLSNAKDGFKGATDLVKEINFMITGLNGIVDKYQVAKGITEGIEQKPSNISGKIEKGIERGIANSPQPKLIIDVDNAIIDLKELINKHIPDEHKGKEIKAQINEMPQDILHNAVKMFMRKYIKIE